MRLTSSTPVKAFHETYQDTIWGHMDPDRIAVPRWVYVLTCRANPYGI